MKDVIQPVPKEKIKNELTRDKFLRYTNYGGNELYVVTHHDSPNLMKEIGRLRELTFRQAGGGTGKEIDTDSFDTCEEPYYQLIVWDPGVEELMGGYRYKICNHQTDPKRLATYKLFDFSDKFVKDYLPYTIELGRSFIQPSFQSTGSVKKTVYALDNLWDGLGALVVDNPECKYFFGKVTMYPHFNQKARDLILHFLDKEFIDRRDLVSPKKAEPKHTPEEELEKILNGETYLENKRILSKAVRLLGENIPPLINAYMNLSRTMSIFGTAVNIPFGNVEETGIMIVVKDVYPEKVERYIESYKKQKNQ